MRADARRNYEKLLASAREVIEKDGAEASLEEVARRAEVGIGTLYRHFPTRDALLEALLRDRFDSLGEQASALLSEPDSLEALATWLRILAGQSSTYRGLTSHLLAAIRDEASELHASCHAMNAAGAALFDRAKDEGRIRGDVSTSEVFALAYSLAFVFERDDTGSLRPERMIGLVMDGLRPR